MLSTTSDTNHTTPTINPINPINPLPASDAQRVLSYNLFPSISRIVEELIFNSIEAGARNIHLEIDFDRFDLKITDDGKNISFS
jgi:DNA mismatch repair ATPase MutL